MQHLFIDVRGLKIYSRIKWAQVFDVPCVGAGFGPWADGAPARPRSECYREAELRLLYCRSFE
jgi:hypothetical protein